MIRAIVAHGLRTYCGYPFPVFAALILALFAHDTAHNQRQGRDLAWWRSEIGRLWHKAKPAKEVRPVLLADERRLVEAPIPAPPLAPRRPEDGRPRRLTLEAYLAWLRKHADGPTGAVMHSTAEIAAALQVCKRTIQRYEHQLRAAGVVERRAFAARQAGCLFLIDAVGRSDKSLLEAAQRPADEAKSTPDTVVTEATADRITTPQTAIDAAHKETRCVSSPPPTLDAPPPAASGQGDSTQRVSSLPAPDEPPTPLDEPPAAPAPALEVEAPAPTLARLARAYLAGRQKVPDERCLLLTCPLAGAYLAAAPEQLGRRSVSADGVVRYRRDKYHFAALVEAEHPGRWPRAAALDAYTAERERLDQLERAENLARWRRWYAWLDATSDAELLAYIAGARRAGAAELARLGGAPLDRHEARTRMRKANEAAQRRGLEVPGKAPQPRPAQRRSTKCTETQRSAAPAAQLALDEAPLVAADPPLEVEAPARPRPVSTGQGYPGPTGDVNDPAALAAVQKLREMAAAMATRVALAA